MADIFSILGNSYLTAPVLSHTAYVRVDPTLYDGTWKGVYSTGEKFSFTISDRSGVSRQGAIPERQRPG